MKTHDMHKCQDTAGRVLQEANISLRKQMRYTHVNKKTRPHLCQTKPIFVKVNLKCLLYHHGLTHFQQEACKLPYLNVHCQIYFREQDVSYFSKANNLHRQEQPGDGVKIWSGLQSLHTQQT